MITFSANTKAKASEVNQNFTDLSTGAADTTDNSLQLYRAEAWNDFVQTGGVWTVVSGLSGAMTAATAYITNSGLQRRVTAAAVPSFTFTASRDTYIEIGSDGIVYYNPLTNGTTPPAVTSGRIRVAMVVTNGTNITQITSLCARRPNEVARGVVQLASGTMTIPGFVAKQYLRLTLTLIPSGGTISAGAKFNNDSGTNYAYRVSDNGGADTSAVSQTSAFLDAGTAAATHITVTNVLNLASQEKILSTIAAHAGAAGGGSTPAKREIVNKWANTSAQITRIDLTTGGTGIFAAGTTLAIEGWN